jgi:anti-anti-sigma factor
MLKAKLEKKLSYDPRDAWWLELNGGVEREAFQLAPAIENNAILQRVQKAKAQKLVVDLTTTKDFDSRGVQLLLILYRQLIDQHIQLVLRNPTVYLSRVLRIMQIDRIFEVEFDENPEGGKESDSKISGH